jgi:hypothetical protein
MRFDWDSVLRKIIFLLIFVIIIVGIVRFVSAIQDEEKFLFCDNYNYSLGRCVSFWNSIESILNVSCGIINNTIEKNVTIEKVVEKNCTSEFNFALEDNRHKEELARIDKGGFDCMTTSECEIKISEAVSNANPPVVPASSEKKEWYDNILIWVVVIGVLIAFFIYKKFGKTKLRGGYYGSKEMPEEDTGSF